MSTKDQQVREVVEGLGLGLIKIGRSQVTSSKINLELAFSHAWREWQGSFDYPSIGRAPKPDNLFWIGVTKSARRRGATVLWEQEGASYWIRLPHEAWTPEDACDIVGTRSLEDWVILARAFVRRLDEFRPRSSA